MAIDAPRLGVLAAVLAAVSFHPPNAEERRRAVGPLEGVPPLLRAALVGGAFRPVPPPGPSDWLAVQPERGQTFRQFVDSRPNRPDAVRPTLYLQPLGAFRPGEAPSLQFL